MTPEEELARIRTDPIDFVERVFGEQVVGKQRDILTALARPGVKEIHVRSCHASGKTHVCARAVPWFLACWPHDSIVLTTAPIWSQVEHLLWREIRDGAARAKVDLGGRLLNTMWEIEPKWYAIGIATSPETAVNIQGFHAAHVLVIVDEADGVPQAIWDAIDGLTTSAHVVVLAIGNPINAQSAWKRRYDLATSDPTAVCIRISADDVLPLTDSGKYPFLLQREWVDDKKRRWGIQHPMYIAKVQANWPDQASDTVLPMALLMAAAGRTVPRGPRGLGVDVARFGSARTVRTLFEGNQFVFSRTTSQEDTMQTAGRVYADIEQLGPVAVWVDDSGVGGGVVDRLRQMDKTVTPVNNGSAAQDHTHYSNRGSELWWNFRLGLEGGYIGLLIQDIESMDELVVELARAKYETDAQGRIRVDKYGLERGRSVRSITDEERATRSPDRADSAVLSWNSVAPMLPNAPVVIKSELDQVLEQELRNADPDHWSGGPEYND